MSKISRKIWITAILVLVVVGIIVFLVKSGRIERFTSNSTVNIPDTCDNGLESHAPTKSTKSSPETYTYDKTVCSDKTAAIIENEANEVLGIENEWTKTFQEISNEVDGITQ